MSRMKKLPELLDTLSFQRINILETGTIRNVNPEYAIGDGHSTLWIAKWIREQDKPVNFYSIDKDVSVAYKYLQELGYLPEVNLIKSNSLIWLDKYIPPEVHFALLDSANDAQNTLNEFKLVEPRMVKGGIVVIDDVIMHSKDVKKGHKVIPYAQTKYRVEVVNRLGIVYF